jgi:hypothetical protein
MLTIFSLPQVLIGLGVLLLTVALIIRWQSRPQGSVAPVPIVPAQPTCELCLQPAQLHEYCYQGGAGLRNAMLCTNCAIWVEARRVEGKV